MVFSDAWWIGTKEENPDELRLEMPLDFQQERHAVYDFAGGAGKPRNIKDDVDVQDSQLELVQVSELESSKQCTPKGQLKMDRWLFQKKPSENKTLEKSFESNAKTKPKNASEWESDEDEEGFVNLGDAPTPSRQSARIAEKKHSYAESSSEENQTDGSDEHDRADAELRDPRDKTVNKLFNDVEDGFLAPESQISQMDLADLTANTIGAGSKQSSLSAFFMKSSEKNKSANVKPPAPLVEISSTRAYQKKKIVKSTLDNDDAGKEDENVTPKDEMESVLPCTPPDINDSKRKRKSTPDGKRNSRGTGGNGKPLAKRGKKIIEATISKEQPLILVQC